MIILGPVAIAENWVIGGDNDLPWYLPEDLKHFKEITLGKTVLMGRKTYDSIFKRLGKPLPGRKNVVITRQKDYTAPEGVLVFNSVDDALKALGQNVIPTEVEKSLKKENLSDPSTTAKASAQDDVYIIGGAEIFKATLPLAEKMYITHVKGEYPGDAFFPEIDFSEWKKIEEEVHDKYTFATYQK